MLLSLLFLSVIFLPSSSSISLTSLCPSLWRGARRIASIEQQVEDDNTHNRVNHFLSQRLLILPLHNNFIPSRYNSLYGKVQYSDKCSFPPSIGSELLGKPYDLPWIFEVTKVVENLPAFSPTTSSSPTPSPDLSPATLVRSRSFGKEADNRVNSLQQKRKGKAYVSTLDFRSPENYMFAPSWVMQKLKVQNYDTVEVKFARVKSASLVILQPTSKNWFNFIKYRDEDTVATILENQINKFSAITEDSNISIKYDGEEYHFHVNRTVSDDGVDVWGVKVQDADVKIDIDTSLIINQQAT